MTSFADDLSMILGGPVIDRTGFTEKFDVYMSFTPDSALSGLRDPESRALPPATAWGSIFAAMENQLGLSVESRLERVEIFVIDDVRKLSEQP
jgi:uncharacterized protein (TIGR03435 family)